MYQRHMTVRVPEDVCLKTLLTEHEPDFAKILYEANLKLARQLHWAQINLNHTRLIQRVEEKHSERKDYADTLRLENRRKFHSAYIDAQKKRLEAQKRRSQFFTDVIRRLEETERARIEHAKKLRAENCRKLHRAYIKEAKQRRVREKSARIKRAIERSMQRGGAEMNIVPSNFDALPCADYHAIPESHFVDSGSFWQMRSPGGRRAPKRGDRYASDGYTPPAMSWLALGMSLAMSGQSSPSTRMKYHHD